MPLKRESFEDKVNSPLGFAENPAQSAPLTATVGEVFGASMRLENISGSAVSQETGLPDFGQVPDLNFDPFALVPQQYRTISERYWNANTPEQVDAITRQIEREQKDRQIVRDSGLLGVGTNIVAGALDPINFIPVGGTAIKGGRVGANILKNGLKTAAVGAGTMTVQEAALQGTQLERSLGESVTNVAAGTFMAGVLGSFAAGVGQWNVARTSKSIEALERGVAEDLTLPNDGVPDLYEHGSITLPADKLAFDAISEKDATGVLKDAGLLSKIPGNQNSITTGPGLRTQLFGAPETKKTVQGLIESPLKYEANTQGVASALPVESVVKQDFGRLVHSLKAVDDVFFEYRLGRASKPGERLLTEIRDLGQEFTRKFDSGQWDGKLNRNQFYEEVGRAMRAGDSHAIPEVRAAAKRMRGEFNRLRDKAVNLGLLGDEVLDNPNYLMRVYNREKIIANRNEFEDINFEWLKQKEMTRPLDAQRTDAELAEVVRHLVNRVINSPDGRLPYDIDLPDAASDFKPRAQKPSSKGKPLKRRAYDIDDGFETYDGKRFDEYLENNVEVVSKMYQRSLSADLALMERFGSVDLEDQIRTIGKEYDGQIKAAKSAAERKRLQKLKQRDLEDVDAMVLRLRGLYRLPENPDAITTRTAKFLKKFNMVRVMGGIVLSSVPDMARPMMVMGLRRYLTDGLVPLVKNFKRFRMSAEETKMAGTALDMLTNSTFANLSEVMDDFGRGSRAERLLGGATEAFGKVSGISQWNSFMKQWSGMMVQTRMLESIEKLGAGKASAKEIENLAASFIDEGMAKRVLSEYKKHGSFEDGIAIANTNAWGDLDAVEHFRAGLSRDVDRIIVTPGVGEKPLWMSTETGSLVGQFKSFFISAHQRVLLSGLQERDLATLNGFVFATALGVTVNMIKAKEAGREIPSDPKALIVEGIDRSGTMGWFFDANNMLEVFTGRGVGINAMLGTGPASRYASRNAVDAVVGPSAGLVADVSRTGRALTTGDVKSSDVRAMRRLMPYQNLTFVRRLFDAGEANLNGYFGTESDRNL